MNHFAAHELLETQESLRTKAAHIELYGVLLEMANDAHLRDILQNQQRRMIQDYEQGVALLTGRGMQNNFPHTPQLRTYENLNIGVKPQQMMPPNPRPTSLSENTIATIVLNIHKTSSAVCMLWATECVDRQIRSYHATCANVCQEMAYEIWQYMNYKGYYQPPELSDKTMNTMIQGYQHQGNPMTQGYQNQANPMTANFNPRMYQ